MAAIQQRPHNLLFSLPDVLMAEVFEFDTTYRIFNTQPFLTELYEACHKKCKAIIHHIVLDYIHEGENLAWDNEYGYMGCNETTDNIPRIEYTSDNYDIYLHYDYVDVPVIYFKILPKGATTKNCYFLRNPQYFDGFVARTDDIDTINESWNYIIRMELCSDVELQYTTDEQLQYTTGTTYNDAVHYLIPLQIEGFCMWF